MPGNLRIGLAWLFAVAFLLLSRPSASSLLLGFVLSLVGLAVRAWAAGTVDKNVALATGGPYAHTRNPLYLGSFVIGVGLSMSGGHWGWPLAFAAFFAAVYAPTIHRESLELTARFGEQYREYSSHVPAFAVRVTPYAGRGFSGSREGFEWRRYLRCREWEALLGVVAAVGVLALKVRMGGQP